MHKIMVLVILFINLFFGTIVFGHIRQVYFSPDDNVAAKFVSYIEAEQESIDIAIYTLTNRDIIQALIDAVQRGIVVNVVIDEYSLKANKNSRGQMERLIDAGINLFLFDPKKFYRGGSGKAQQLMNQHDFLSGYKSHSNYNQKDEFSKFQIKQLSIRPVLHHKFCIFGKNENNMSLVWTGSFNFTYFGTSRNQENSIVLGDRDVIDAFRKQFKIILRERVSQLDSYRLNKNEPGIQIYFAPDQDIVERLIHLINQEQKEIKVAIYSLSHVGVVQALIRAHNRGVRVVVLLDHGKKAMLARAGIPVYLFVPEKCHSGMRNKQFELIERGRRVYALMHNKFCIFARNKKDKRLLWTGSTNCTYFSDQIFQNNALVLDDNQLIDKFEQQFELIRENRTRLYQAPGVKWRNLLSYAWSR